MLCLIWGSTWLVIKVGYGGLGPFNVAAIRFFLAGIVMALIVPMTGARWPRRRSEWALVVAVALLMFAGDYGAIYWSEQYIDSGLTAILFATLPLLTIAVAHVYLPGERITAPKLAGTLLAFVGVMALFGGSRPDRCDAALADAGGDWRGALRRDRRGREQAARRGLHPAALNAPSMLIGAVVLAGVSARDR